MKTSIFIFSFMMMNSAFALVTGLSPASNVTTVYEFWMGQNADCLDMVKVIDLGPAGKDVDTEQALDIAKATLPPAGTYNCIAIVVLDAAKMRPSTTAGGCDSTKTYTQRTFRNADITVLPSDPNTIINPNGKNGVGGLADFVPQKVAAYFSTSGAIGHSGHAPSDALPLAGGAIAVGSSSMSKTFYVDCRGTVQDNESSIDADTGAAATCFTEPCEVGFR